jgi:hypothetical protein
MNCAKLGTVIVTWFQGGEIGYIDARQGTVIGA